MRTRGSLARVPLLVSETRVWRFYDGGRLLDERRGRRPGVDGPFPEDWIASTTSALGTPPAFMDRSSDGLSRVKDPDGVELVLRDVIDADPEGFLGPLGASSEDVPILVKVLDPSVRLPVHAHPHRDFAQQHLGARRGKAEAWIILDVRGAQLDPHVFLGLREPVSPAVFLRWMQDQEVDQLCAAMHRISVSPGDVIYVPPGILHSIGPGILIAEVQEPSDLSIICEYSNFGLERDAASLGLSWKTAIRALNLEGMPRRHIESELRGRVDEGTLFRGEAASYFRAQTLGPGSAAVVSDFSVMMCVGGTGELEYSEGRVRLHAGDSYVLPAALGEISLTGDFASLIFQGPNT